MSFPENNFGIYSQESDSTRGSQYQGAQPRDDVLDLFGVRSDASEYAHAIARREPPSPRDQNQSFVFGTGFNTGAHSGGRYDATSGDLGAGDWPAHNTHSDLNQDGVLDHDQEFFDILTYLRNNPNARTDLDDAVRDDNEGLGFATNVDRCLDARRQMELLNPGTLQQLKNMRNKNRHDARTRRARNEEARDLEGRAADAIRETDLATSPVRRSSRPRGRDEGQRGQDLSGVAAVPAVRRGRRRQRPSTPEEQSFVDRSQGVPDLNLEDTGLESAPVVQWETGDEQALPRPGSPLESLVHPSPARSVLSTPRSLELGVSPSRSPPLSTREEQVIDRQANRVQSSPNVQAQLREQQERIRERLRNTIDDMDNSTVQNALVNDWLGQDATTSERAIQKINDILSDPPKSGTIENPDFRRLSANDIKLLSASVILCYRAVQATCSTTSPVVKTWFDVMLNLVLNMIDDISIVNSLKEVLHRLRGLSLPQVDTGGTEREPEKEADQGEEEKEDQEEEEEEDQEEEEEEEMSDEETSDEELEPRERPLRQIVPRAVDHVTDIIGKHTSSGPRLSLDNNEVAVAMNNILDNATGAELAVLQRKMSQSGSETNSFIVAELLTITSTKLENGFENLKKLTQKLYQGIQSKIGTVDIDGVEVQIVKDLHPDKLNQDNISEVLERILFIYTWLDNLNDGPTRMNIQTAFIGFQILLSEWLLNTDLFHQKYYGAGQPGRSGHLGVSISEITDDAERGVSDGSNNPSFDYGNTSKSKPSDKKSVPANRLEKDMVLRLYSISTPGNRCIYVVANQAKQNSNSLPQVVYAACTCSHPRLHGNATCTLTPPALKVSTQPVKLSKKLIALCEDTTKLYRCQDLDSTGFTAVRVEQ